VVGSLLRRRERRGGGLLGRGESSQGVGSGVRGIMQRVSCTALGDVAELAGERGVSMPC
jgi:hypothetical protein